MSRVGSLIALVLAAVAFASSAASEDPRGQIAVADPAAAAGGTTMASEAGSRARAASKVWPRALYPPPGRVRAARRFAEDRPGAVSFAVVGPLGGVRGLDMHRQFSSASASKALLLAAELRRLRRARDPLDPGTRSLLRAMITVSDNDAAGEIYARVGDGGLLTVARKAGMRDFEAIPGYWGGAQITAADTARFYFRLDRHLAGPHRRFAKRLLASITESQRWGIPAAAGRTWHVWFKGGWRPPDAKETSGPVTHQAALLVHGGGQRVAIAVLTDQVPGGSSFGTIEGIARRLLRVPPISHGLWPSG